MTGQQHKEPGRFENKLTRYFDDFLNDVGLSRGHGGIRLRGTGGTDGKQSSWSPAIDIRENDREYVVIADVPGVAKEDLDVELHETLLVISGQNKQDPHDTPHDTAYSQEIGIDKDSQSTGPHHHQPTGPQHHQQPNNIQQPTGVQQQTGVQQSSEPLQYQGRKDKQPEYQQDRKDKQPEYQQDRKDKQPYQQSQPGEQQYHQKQDDRYQQQPNAQDDRYQQQQSNERYPQDDRYQQQPDERRYQQQDDRHQQPDERRYQQSDDRYQQPDERRHQQPDERRYQQSEEQAYQSIPKHNHRQQTQGERVHIQERPYGYFSRTIQLPNNIKAEDDFYANLSNGVLKIKIPKSNDKPKKKITIS